MKKLLALATLVFMLLSAAFAFPEALEPSDSPHENLQHAALSPSAAVIVNSTTLSCYLHHGTRYVEAAGFAHAAGLDYYRRGAQVTLTGLHTLTLRARDLSIQLDGLEQSLAAAPLLDRGTFYLPLIAVSRAMEFGLYHDPQNAQLYITPAAGRWALPEDVHVPVLMYHAVSDEMWGIQELFVSPKDMEAQLQYLNAHGYDTIWFEDLAHIEDYDKPVILTFDDGYDDNYTELFPLLKKYNAKATIFVIADAMGNLHKMTAEQVKELSDSGLVSIQSHTATHGNLSIMDEQTLHYELGESQRILTELTGKEISVICYPEGRFSDLALKIARHYYPFGLKMNGGLYNTSHDPLLINRYYISRWTDLYAFAAFVSYAGQ